MRGSEIDVREVTADPEHLEIVLDHRPEAVRPHVVRLARGAETAALAVGRIEDVELPARIGYRKVLSPRVRALTLVQGGYLGDASEPAAHAVFSELTEALTRGEADVLRLRLLEIGSPSHQLAPGTPAALCRQRPPGSQRALAGREPDTSEGSSRPARRAFEKTSGTTENVSSPTTGTGSASRCSMTAPTASAVPGHALDAAKTYQQALGAPFEDTPLRRRHELSIRRGWFGATRSTSRRARPLPVRDRVPERGPDGFDGYELSTRDLSIGTHVLDA